MDVKSLFFRIIIFFFKKKSQKKPPLLFRAPECLVSQIYSTKSDVWAWGVTIVEILSRQDPYPTLDAIQTVIFVREGNRMPIPDVAGPEIVNLIRASWKELPQERPTFAVKLLFSFIFLCLLFFNLRKY